MEADRNATAGQGGPGRQAALVRRLVIVNAALFVIGAAVTLALRPSMTAGYAVGYALGVVNLAWLLRIAGRTTGMTPEKAGRYAARNYYLRFVLTALVLAFLIIQGVLNEPWHPIVGLTVCIFATVAVFIAAAREEASEDRCTT